MGGPFRAFGRHGDIFYHGALVVLLVGLFIYLFAALLLLHHWICLSIMNKPYDVRLYASPVSYCTIYTRLTGVNI